ncbi:acyl-CoA synthetase (AMP-forming)/AMP-acid ligase II [Nocardia mexicana]|uniref:Acyl-CoA synthetase (AMP-forming)/AMP-acid ligase II n=1 Tax=Nocardia mexicana TaxID=279262 RepID=A0A370GNQ4_9NOCA|nr:acyl-CoA synthetase (AMP-forming)/AMP-acid ligase II [Nocardia mexicana]
MLIHDYIDYWAMRKPHELCATDGERSLTWLEMQVWTRKIASWLGSRMESGRRFGILSRNSLEIFALYFGASRVGAVAVPLNVRLAPPEWKYILNDANVELLIAEEEFTDAVESIRNDLQAPVYLARGRKHGWKSFEEEISAGDSDVPERAIDITDPLYQMYTSGTTGLPKGAVLSHLAVTSNVLQIQAGLQIAGSQGLVVMPLFHGGAAISTFLFVAHGMTVRILREFNPDNVVELLKNEPIAAVTLVPSMIQMLLQVPSVTDGNYEHLDVIAYGAAPIASDVLRKAIATFGCRFAQGYGLTETSATATVLYPDDHELALRGNPGLLLSAGRPMLATEIRIVDSNGGELPPGEIGEVMVRGPQLMSGYANLPDATAASLRDGWLSTGDAGYLDSNGYLFLSDRVKDMIVSGGENVYPREIEEVLFKLAGVLDAAVVGVPDERWGEVPLAFIVADPQQDLRESDVIEHCRQLLARYKCPQSVEFVSALPLNATGKILKRELRAPYWRGRERSIG